MKLLLFVTAIAGLGACVSAPSASPVEVPLELPQPAGFSATITQVVDVRPEALVRSRLPHIESHYSVLLAGSGFVFIDGARYEGASHHGDETLRITSKGARRSPVEAVAELVGALAGGGRAPVPLDPGAARRGLDPLIASLSVKEGWVLIPFLDQLDVSALSSRNSMAGGSSYESGRSATTVTNTTTSGAATLSASVGAFANARVRLLAVELQGGRAVRRAWIHGRGVGPDLKTALRGLATSLAEGLQEVSR